MAPERAGELQVVVDPAQGLGSCADLVDGGAFVGADDLPLVEEDHGQRDVFDHGGQVRRQRAGAASFDALCFVDDERARLAGGAAQGAGRGEQFAGGAVAADGIQGVGAQGAGGSDEAGTGRGVDTHDPAEQPHSEGGLATARTADHRDGRTLAAPVGRRVLPAGGQMAGRGCTNPHERILLVTHQSEGVVAFQVGADMVEQPAAGLPPDVLEDLHLPGVRCCQVGAAQQFCQRPRWRGQTADNVTTTPHGVLPPRRPALIEVPTDRDAAGPWVPGWWDFPIPAYITDERQDEYDRIRATEQHL